MKYNSLFVMMAVCLVFSSCSKSNSSGTAGGGKSFSDATAKTVTVSTLAGSQAAGNADGAGTAASFNQPSAIATDANDNLYVTDYGNSVIRKITPAGVVTTTSVAGYADGGIAIDNSGDFYVASGYVPGTVYRFAPDGTRSGWVIPNAGYAIVYQAIDRNSGSDYISVLGSNIVFTLSSQGVGSQFAQGGDGIHYTRGNTGLAVDAGGNVFVTENIAYNDGYVSQIYKITPDGTSTLYAGAQTYGSMDGPAATATFTFITGIAIDKNNNLFILDANKVRMVNASGIVSTLAGSAAKGYTDGSGDQAAFSSPTGISVNKEGTAVYIADNNNNCIRKITAN
ncbi:MAG: hypothetical protein P4L51_17560 [Puia sp.]|nr:hypothetical protein [Puia sp.]